MKYLSPPSLCGRYPLKNYHREKSETFIALQVRALEIAYEDDGHDCNTNEYPDNKLLTVVLGLTGIILTFLCLTIGKPLDRSFYPTDADAAPRFAY